jgi:hypothetical protein
MKKMIIAISVLVGALAHADGFKCITESGLNIKVYNHIDPSKGTRNAAVMVVSDANVGLGNKTIATFYADKGVLTSRVLTYVAKVDLRVSESNRAGELIGGTKLGYLARIILNVDFSYSSPLFDGEKTSATLLLQKRDGKQAVESAICTRYLKN